MKPPGQRPSPEDMFARLDADASGSLDQSELQSMIDRMSAKMGSKGQSADDMMSKMDSDGDGALSLDEFAAGRPQGPPPGGPQHGGQGQMTKASSETDLLQQLLDMFKSSDEEESTQLYAGILA